MNGSTTQHGRLVLACFACLGAGGALGQATVPATGRVDAGDSLAEIVVTAQKVESTVQRTPIDIQTVSNQQLIDKGVQNTQDLTKLVPGFSVRETGGGSSFFFRGVGTYNEDAASDSGLAVSLDQMYFSRPFGPDLVLYDMQRIEVLKGPQGTLYGRNATGGSVNFISNKPIIGEFGGTTAVEFGNYNALKVNGAVNLPIAETVAVRVAFETNRHSGYMKDGYDDADSDAARVHVLWQPSEDTSLLLTAEYLHSGPKGPGDVPFVNQHFVTSDPWAGGASPQVRTYVGSVSNPLASSITNATFANGAYVASPYNCLPACNQVGLFAPSQQPGPYNTETNGFVHVTVPSFRADLEQNLGFATLSVIPTELLTSTKVLYYNAGTGIYTETNDHQSSFETRLTSPQNHTITWIGGLFYLHEKQAYDGWNAGGFPNLISYGFNPDVEATSKAVFGQLDYHILPTLTATLGARYTKEDKISRGFYGGNESYLPAGVPGPAPGFSPPQTSSYDSSANTYRAALEWEITPTSLLYASYSTGYHPGGFNGGAPAKQPICTPKPTDTGAQLQAAFGPQCDVDINFKPEHLEAFAVGSKNRFLDNTVQVNVELYDWKYKDFQQYVLSATNGGNGVKSLTLFTTNAGNASIRGVDLDGKWLVTANDQVDVTYNYNHATYGQYITYFVIPNAVAFVNNYTGKQVLDSPADVAAFDYAHTFTFGNGSRLIPSVDGKYSSKIYYAYNPDIFQSQYVKYNLNLGYREPKDTWSVNAFVRNVGNKATIVRAVQSAPATGIPWAFLAAPRTYGVNLSLKF